MIKLLIIPLLFFQVNLTTTIFNPTLTFNQKVAIMKTIYAHADQLRAALLTSAVKDIRYYLNTVLVEASGNYTRIVSTDGHRMSVMGNANENSINQNELLSFMVPTNIVKLINSKVKMVIFTFNEETNIWTMKSNSISVNFKPGEGKYPDWRRVLRTKNLDLENAKPVHFNPEYLMDFVKQAKILGCHKNNLCPFIDTINDTESGRITFQGLANYVAICMPVRVIRNGEKLQEIDPMLTT